MQLAVAKLRNGKVTRISFLNNGVERRQANGLDAIVIFSACVDQSTSKTQSLLAAPFIKRKVRDSKQQIPRTASRAPENRGKDKGAPDFARDDSVEWELRTQMSTRLLSDAVRRCMRIAPVGFCTSCE